jgi:hypothetical protein
MAGAPKISKKALKKGATMRAAGASYREVGKAINRGRHAASALLKTDAAIEIMQACHAELIRSVPKAVGNIVVAVDDFTKAYSEGNKVRAGIAWEATKLVTQIPGLTPSNQTSIVHQTFINNQTNVLDPTIAALIKEHLSGYINSIEIEAEPVKAIEITEEA